MQTIDKITQKASLVGRVIEDLTYETVNPSRFQAELVDFKKKPEYKSEGFFVFSDLPAQKYTLRIAGAGWQTFDKSVTVPEPVLVPEPVPLRLDDLVIDSAGDDELIVVVRSIPNNGNDKSITFDPVILPKEIRAGSRVISPNLTTKLAAALQVGPRSQAKLENVDGITVGEIIRIIRDKSIRMKFDPYHTFEIALTRMVGKVVSQQNLEVPLAGVQVQVTKLDDGLITWNDMNGAKIATVIDGGGSRIVLGVDKDLTTITNKKGDYNLYFNKDILTSFKITEQSLQRLQALLKPADGDVPPEVLNVLNRLRPRKDQIFRSVTRLTAVIEQIIEDEGAEDKIESSLILKHSENFSHGITVQASLSGHQTESKTELVAAGQRKAINFQLLKA